MTLEAGKYLFVAELSKGPQVSRLYGRVLFGEGCKTPLEVVELGFIHRKLEDGTAYYVGDLTIEEYTLNDEFLDEEIELLHTPQFLGIFKAIKIL